MGVRARLRAVCVVANPRNSQAIAVVCASQPIPNRIPHTFIRDHEHVLRNELPILFLRIIFKQLQVITPITPVINCFERNLLYTPPQICRRFF